MASNPNATLHKSLQDAATRLADIRLGDLMRAPDRQKFIFGFEDLQADCTRQPIDEQSLSLLLELAKERGLKNRLEEMFSGAYVNLSEDRPVVHCDLRHPDRLATDEFKQLSAFAENLRGHRDITAIVNLGIGGSDLGPAMVVQALAGYHDGPACYFVGNICPTDLHDVLAKCEAGKTLFIVTSKTFTTAETLTNAELAKAWLAENGIEASQAMVAVTAYGERALKWGIFPDHIFSFAEGVGGRYSLWSAVGLSVMIAIGAAAFSDMLAGAYAMDKHIRESDFDKNIGVIMGLLRVWHRSYLNATSYGLMPYDQRLARLPAWAQQLEMESNGKQVDRHGKPLSRPAGPLIWGEPGTNSQHSFFQWLHQGVEVVPVDILVAMQPAEGLADKKWQASHQMLAINAVAQAEALALGSENIKEPHRHFPGNRPSILLSWDKTTPYALGRLLALYEHITVVSGFIWDVNSFDQWGVELGKQMANSLQSDADLGQFSPAAKAFLERLKQQ